MAFRGDKSGHGVFDQAGDGRHDVPHFCLTHVYRHSSWYRAHLLARVPLAYGVIDDGAERILSIRGGMISSIPSELQTSWL